MLASMRRTRFGPAITRASSSGVILLEVLIAFAILSLALGTLLQTTGNSIARQRVLDNQIRAASHAANMLAELESGNIDASSLSGKIDDSYHWYASFQPVAAAQGVLTDSEPTVALMKVSLEIRWRESGREKSYQLSTKRIVTKKMR